MSLTRFQTIMPCSNILLMNKGNLIQQGSPLELIHREGPFQDLCMAAGEEEYKRLIVLAEEHNLSNKGDLVNSS